MGTDERERAVRKVGAGEPEVEAHSNRNSNPPLADEEPEVDVEDKKGDDATRDVEAHRKI